MGQDGINVSADAGTSLRPSMTLKSSTNYPAIAWQDDTNDIGSSNEIFYLQWNGSTWVDADGEGQTDIVIYSSSTDTYYPSLDLNSQNNPAIAWTDDANYNPYYLEWYIPPSPCPDPDPGPDINVLPETGIDFVDYVNELLI